MDTTTTPKTPGDPSGSFVPPEINKIGEIPDEYFYTHRDFMFSGVGDERDKDLVLAIGDLELYLNANISLKDYSREITAIGYLPIVRWIYDPLEKNEATYDVLDQEIHIQTQVFPPDNQADHPPERAWLHNLGRKLIESLVGMGAFVPLNLINRIEELVEKILSEPAWVEAQIEAERQRRLAEPPTFNTEALLLAQYAKKGDFQFMAVIKNDKMELATWLSELEDHFNANIRLRDYTSLVPHIHFTPIFLKKDDPLVGEEVIYEVPSNEIFIQKKVLPPRWKLWQKQEAAWKYHIGSLLLASLRELPSMVPPTLLGRIETLVKGLRK